MSSRLSVQGISFAYTDKPVLDGLDLTLSEGELLGLLGPNGAGKTTLLTLMAGLMQPQQGQIHIGGHHLATAPLLARSQLGLVFQSISLDRFMTVSENLLFAGGLQGLSRRAVQDRIQALSVELKLEPLLHKKVLALSGGQQRLVDITRALIHSPSVLLLDEPTHGLDVMARQQVWAMLNQLRVLPDGPSILVSTHLMDEASTCDRVCFLKQGRLVWTGTPREALAQLPHQPAQTVVPSQSLSDWFVWSMNQ